MKHIAFTVVERDGIFRVSLCPPKSLIIKNPLTPTASSRDAGAATKRCVELLDDEQRDIMEIVHGNDLKDYITINDKYW